MDSYTRGSLAAFLGIGLETIRYYEKHGLIPLPRRNTNGYRIYSQEDANTIRHLLIAKTYGFSLKEIKEAIETTKPNSKEFEALIRRKVAEIEQKIRELKSIQKRLLDLLPTKKRQKA